MRLEEVISFFFFFLHKIFYKAVSGSQQSQEEGTEAPPTTSSPCSRTASLITDTHHQSRTFVTNDGPTLTVTGTTATSASPVGCTFPGSGYPYDDVNPPGQDRHSFAALNILCAPPAHRPPHQALLKSLDQRDHASLLIC